MRSSIGKVAQVSALLHIYMVAGSYWRPTLRAGGLRVDPRALGPAIVVQTMTSKPGAAQCWVLPGFQVGNSTFGFCLGVVWVR